MMGYHAGAIGAFLGIIKHDLCRLGRLSGFEGTSLRECLFADLVGLSGLQGLFGLGGLCRKIGTGGGVFSLFYLVRLNASLLGLPRLFR